MSPTGLQKFIDGSQPYGPTVLKLRQWYALRPGAPLEEQWSATIEPLLRDLAPDARDEVRAELLAIVVRSRGIRLEPAHKPLPPRAARKPAPRKPPSLDDVRAAVAHFRVVLRTPGLSDRARHHVRAGIRTLGE